VLFNDVLSSLDDSVAIREWMYEEVVEWQ
jgi:hypothetical protein